MSTPLNPLDKYRGFSTHHIVVVAHTSETIRALTTRKSGSQDSSFLDRASEAKLGEPIKSGLGDSMDAYLIIDSRKLSNYTVMNVDYQTVFSSGALPQTQLITGMVNMTIFDTYGITFINYLKYLCDEIFFTDYNGLIFLLKTVYVGHTDSGTTEVISSCEIPMILVNIDISVDHTGGTYSIQFAPLNGAVNQAFPDINYATSINILRGKNLGEIFDNLQNELNRKIREFYVKLNLKPDTTKKVKTVGRPVQYMFTLPGDVIPYKDNNQNWRNFKMTGVLDVLKEQDNKLQEESKKKEEEEKRYTTSKNESKDKWKKDGVSDAEINNRLKKHDEEREAAKKTQFENRSNVFVLEGSTEDLVYLSISPKSTIEQVISVVMSMCPEVNHKMSYGPLAGKKVERYKTKTFVTSDASTITMHYDIIEQTIVDVNQEDQNKKNAKTSAHNAFFKDGKPINGIEFDYIFTGKNTDILSYDIKINNANLYLTNVDKLSEDSRQEKDVGNSDQKSKLNEKIKIDEKQLGHNIAPNSPITAATRTQYEHNAQAAITQGNANRLGKEPSDLTQIRQEALNTMSDLHGVSSQDIRMTIRGNPDLLSKSLEYGEMLPHVTVKDIMSISVTADNTFNPSDVAVYKQKLKAELEQSKAAGELNGPDISVSPLYCKVNIFGPNVDIYGTPIDDRFAKQYWYDGWYYVNSINHLFKDGHFTQEITMNAIDMFKRYKSTDNQGDQNA